VLEESIGRQIRDLFKKLEASGDVLPSAKLNEYFATFRKKFGPEVLATLDGEALLTTMHEHGQKDSLVYWLEFKDDDELPAWFGSIAGGSALKFGIYRRKETGLWMTGSPQNQQELPTAAAIQIARTHRDELIAGCKILERLPDNASDDDYAALQRELDVSAPTVSDTAWGHKYFNMIYPDKLDDFHNPYFGQFHLIKILVRPPDGDGRYLAAGYFVRVARELGMRINQLTTILNYRDGNPHAYWRIGTSDGSAPRNRWDLMRSGNCVAIGWPSLGDLSHLTPDAKSREGVKELMASRYPNDPRAVGRSASEVFRFVTTFSERDLVLACDGATVLGVARITGNYSHVPGSDFPHRRPVEWLSTAEWKLPEEEGLRTTVYEMKKAKNLLEAERLLQSQRQSTSRPMDVQVTPGEATFTGALGRIQAILERKGQIILYGPPGTGKTHWAFTAALELAASHYFNKPARELTKVELDYIQGSGEKRGIVRNCTFHPAYGYEDFIEGFRPTVHSGGVAFTIQPGIFKQVCDDAAKEPGKKFFLIIDEINRGDIPRIFGELLTVLEKNKRGKTVTLPLSHDKFHVPEAVYLLATMNTADRSIALLDTALRRRFGFMELMPNSAVVGETVIKGIPVGLWLDSLNQRICENVGRNARNLQIGHSYFLENGQSVSSLRQLAKIVQEDVVPLLEEYCYEDYVKLEKILGKGLVDAVSQRVRHELFEPNREGELIQALLEPCPDLTTTSPVVSSVESTLAADESDDTDSDSSQSG
jgi:5-methylcytosine-specific restriction protein B